MQNGRLPDSALAPIPHGRLEKKAAAAWNDMRAEIIRQGGPAIRPLGPNSSYRTYQAQVYYKHLQLIGQGNPAATPGTSNHGWGNAVDVQTPAMAQWILKVGPQFGWSHAEGARVGEWWHFTYVGGYRPRKRDALAYLSREEALWLRELIHLRKARRGLAKRARLVALLTRQRREVYRYAKKNGWTHKLKVRYNTLLKYTKG